MSIWGSTGPADEQPAALRAAKDLAAGVRNEATRTLKGQCKGGERSAKGR